MNTLLTARERELYINVVSTIKLPKELPHDFAVHVVDWLALNMPEELEGGCIYAHAVEVAAVHLGWIEP